MTKEERGNKRRAKGDNSITRLPNGKLRVRVDCGTIDGKRKQLSRVCETLREAQRVAKDFEAERDALLKSKGLTGDRNNFLYVAREYNKMVNIRENTRAAYDHYLKQAAPFFRYIKFTEISTKDINNYIDHMRAEGYADGTIRCHMNWLSSVFNHAVDVGIIGRSPCRGANVPRGKKLKDRRDILSQEEQERLIGLCLADYEHHLDTGETPKHRKPGATRETASYLYNTFYVLFMVALETGMREGEITGLKWENINMDAQEIYVETQVQYLIKSHRLADVDPKTATSARTLVFSQRLREILERYKKYCLSSQKGEYLWTNKRNQRANPYTLRTALQSYCLLAGITREITFHMLRHTNATETLEASGNDLVTVSERLGHASVTTTAGIYVHFVKDKHRKTVENLSRKL